MLSIAKPEICISKPLHSSRRDHQRASRLLAGMAERAAFQECFRLRNSKRSSFTLFVVDDEPDERLFRKLSNAL